MCHSLRRYIFIELFKPVTVISFNSLTNNEGGLNRLSEMPKQITIIGGGIAGLTTAIALNKIGIKTTVFEAAPAVRSVGAGLALAANAMMAFKKLGIMDEVIERGRTLSAFSIYDDKGRLITQADSRRLSQKYGIDNFTIHRADLHQLLSSKVDSGSIHINKRAIDVEQKPESIIVKFQDGSTHEAQYLVAADGINSPIRKKLLPRSLPRYGGYTCWRSVIDNTNLDISETSETWGTKGRFGIAPLANRKIYWFACVNAKQNDPIFKNYTTKDLLNIFKNFHEPIPSILQETKDENLLWNDIVDLKPIHQYAHGNILLIGDAAHATTPNMGQGACQAIEDSVILGDELSKTVDIKQAFVSFAKRRLKRTHFIINTSRVIGKMTQLENSLLTNARNFVFRMTPASVHEKQMKKIYEVDF